VQLTPLPNKGGEPQDITALWAEAKKEEVEQYKLRVLSRRNATLAPSKLGPIEEVPEPDRS
jgi:hypothetical protein